MCAEITKTQKCTLVHNSGVKFNVNLTPYELKKPEEDEVFATQLIEKYFKMYKSNLVTAATDNNLSNNIVSLPSCSNEGGQQEESYHSNNYDFEYEESQEDLEGIRNYLTNDDDELLISLVSLRPPLFDMRLPLKERSRETIKSLWEEIISEMNIRVTVKQISSRWKNIRDSFLRARANINKKIASGSSAEDKIKADNIKAKHKHYELLQFLEDTLTSRRTSSNVENDDSPDSPAPSITPTGRGTKRNTENSADEVFFQKMDILCGSASNSSTPLTSTQHFCMRLAESLQKLPNNIKNKLEIEFLQKVSEAEELYCDQ